MFQFNGSYARLLDTKNMVAHLYIVVAPQPCNNFCKVFNYNINQACSNEMNCDSFHNMWKLPLN